jgi:hypothetical protein
MKIPRLDYDPVAALAFFEESLTTMGALCERTWHDRLEVAAEDRPATLWNEQGSLHVQELFFAAADTTVAREAGREVFPGCPLTFRLAELLRPAPLMLEKLALGGSLPYQLPEHPVLEKLWRTQYPATRQWRLACAPKLAFHFSLVAVVRCEIQALDQHWSLHRVALALPGGETDEPLARQIPLLELDVLEPGAVPWPATDAARWWALLQREIEAEMTPDVQAIRARQEQYLQREIQRIDEYFAHYENELARRRPRGGEAASIKTGERLAAARAEHARRRLDQVARHEIRVQPHVDALLLVAERAWEAVVQLEEQRSAQAVAAKFVPRTRRWLASTSNVR